MPKASAIWSRISGPLLIGWRILVSNHPRAIILVAGSLSIALATASLAAAAVTSRTIVAQTVDAGWRGTYDLLVQAADATTLTVGGKQVVPSDFLATRSSGITRAQWQAIQEIPGVEVAAPLATLGWLRPDAALLSATFDMPGPGELIRIDAVFQIPDGSVQHDVGYIGFDYSDPEHPEDVVDTFASGGYGGGVVDAMLDLSLPAGWGSVVGIDPVEENKLVGLDAYIAGNSLQRGLTTSFDPSYGVIAIRVPVITPARSSWPGQVTMTITKISGVDVVAIGQALDDSPLGYRDVGLIEQLAEGSPAAAIASQTAALDDLVQPLRDTSVTFSGGNFVTGAGSFSSVGRNVVLLPGDAPYGVNSQDQPTLASLGTWAELVAPAIDAAQPRNFRHESSSLDQMLQYRPLQVTVPDPFIVGALGTYDLEAIATRYADATNYVPLGIYGDPARQLVTDAAGDPVDEALPVSLNPGGLNPLPPIGLTNLETVEALRGERFIDAIRIRVSGVDVYTTAAVERIERVAAAIYDRTGLHVDVVAGSSPVDVNVVVSGVGTVRERWTTLGEAPRIIGGAEGLSGLLLGAAGLVVALYIGTFGVFLVDDQRHGLEILRQIGWRRTSRTWLLVSQALVLGLAAAVLSVGLLAIFDAVTDVYVPTMAYPVAALTVIAAHMTAAALAAVTRRMPRDRAVGDPPRWLSLGVVRLGLRNSLEAPRRFVIVAVALALAILVAAMIAAVEIAYGGDLRATVLGNLVWLRVGWYHLLAAGAALFAAASIALDSGVLAVERRVSLIALLRATGWRGRSISNVISVEVGLPPFAGGLLAVIPVIAIGAWVGLGWPLLVVLGAGAVVLGTLVALVVAALPARLAMAVDPARGLAAEGMTGSLPGFATRAALATIVVLALFVSGVGVGYGVIAPAAIPANAFVPVPTVAPPTATELALAAHVEAVADRPDRAPDSASLDWTFDYVADFLAAHGGQTSEQTFVSYEAQWFDAGGSTVNSIGPVVRQLAIAPEFNPTAASPFTASTSEQPVCVAGLMALRVSNSTSPTMPFDVLSRCAAAGTTAVLAARPISDEAWNVVASAASVQLVSGRILWATVGTPIASTPVLVVPMGSTGPGAAQSAAPIAVALELAAKADAAGLPLRLAFADLSQRGTLSVFVRQAAETMPGAPVIELGPLGGRLAPVLGERWTETLDEASTRGGLLGSVVVDDLAPEWVGRTSHLAATDTSDALLAAMAGGVPPHDVRLDGVIAPSALAVGIDAAYLGEPTSLETDTGTAADTAGQIDTSTLDHALAQLASALEDLDGH